jgi:hypothetical protein
MLYFCEDECETPDHAYFTALAKKNKEWIPFVSKTTMKSFLVHVDSFSLVGAGSGIFWASPLANGEDRSNGGQGCFIDLLHSLRAGLVLIMSWT